jgi:hypothetical protein
MSSDASFFFLARVFCLVPPSIAANGQGKPKCRAYHLAARLA